jgi:hypothetical protein
MLPGAAPVGGGSCAQKDAHWKFRLVETADMDSSSADSQRDLSQRVIQTTITPDTTAAEIGNTKYLYSGFSYQCDTVEV